MATPHGSASLGTLEHVPALQLSAVQGLPSLQFLGAPETHSPPWHASPTVQALLSSQAPVWAVCAQPLAGTQESAVQALPSLQFAVPVPVHAPLTQLSPVVHALPSLQLVPFPRLTCLQPTDVSQLSVVQGWPSSQETAVRYAQLPPEHWSPEVHALLSEQVARSLATCLHPLEVTHESVVHVLASSQPRAAPPWHAPFEQLSPVVQALPSSQGPLALAWVQPAIASHASMVHATPSSQPMGLPGTHAPPRQLSPDVQTLLSVQVAALARCVQPVWALQPSLVHGLPSEHSAAVPPRQLPPAHASPTVQALPSVHVAALARCVQPVGAEQPSVVQGLLSTQLAAPPG